MSDRVTALFDQRNDAEAAVDTLRSLGVSNDHISVVAQDSHGHTNVGDGNAAHEAADAGERTAKGALAGAGAGALFGLAALAIPGVGPFITAGWLAAALGVTGGAVASGAIVGGTSGALAGLLAKAGYDKDEADHYGSHIERGGIMVAVNTQGAAIGDIEARRVLEQFGGQTWGNQSASRMAA